MSALNANPRPVGVLHLERSGTVVRVDAEAASLLGGTPDALCGRRLADCLPGLADEPQFEDLRRALVDRRPGFWSGRVQGLDAIGRDQDLQILPQTDGLRIVSRPTAPRSAQPQSLATTVRDLEPGLRQGLPAHAHFEVHVDDSTPAVSAARETVAAAILCLIQRSAAAIRSTGRITLSVGWSTSAHPPVAVIVVHDDGLGLEDMASSALTESGIQAPRPEFAAVHALVADCGGRVECDSDPDLGTVVRLRLPILARRSWLGPRPTLPPLRSGSTVLVVDDLPEIAELVGRILATASHRVLLANDGEAAISLWQRHRQEVDLLITDLTMPGLSGNDLVATLRADRPDLPVVCISGFQGSSGPNAAPSDVAFLAKPFSPQQLLDLVRRSTTSSRVGGTIQRLLPADPC